MCASRTLSKPSCGTITAHEVNAAGTRLYFLAADESDPQARYTDAARFFLLAYELDFSGSDDKHGGDSVLRFTPEE